MGRKRKRRRVRFWPEINRFRPVVRRRQPIMELAMDELEALRLVDSQNLEQIKAAQQMGISQSTLQRILSRARQRLAQALITGQEIRLKGGEKNMINQNFGRGRRQGFAAGPGGYCVCSNPQCGYKAPHQAGMPCYRQKCPKCGSPMIREAAQETLKPNE